MVISDAGSDFASQEIRTCRLLLHYCTWEQVVYLKTIDMEAAAMIEGDHVAIENRAGVVLASYERNVFSVTPFSATRNKGNDMTPEQSNPPPANRFERSRHAHDAYDRPPRIMWAIFKIFRDGA